VTATGDKREEQRAQIWSGCQTVLGCGGVIALCALIYFAVGWPLAAAARPGPDVIVFLYAKEAQNAVFWCVLVGGIVFFLLTAAAKTSRGLVIVCVSFLTALGLGGYGMYSRVAAITFHEGSVELRFVWPRPAVRLSPEEVVSVEYEESVSASEGVLLEYTLHLHTQRGNYVSFADANQEDMRETQRRIEEMQGRRRPAAEAAR